MNVGAWRTMVVFPPKPRQLQPPRQFSGFDPTPEPTPEDEHDEHHGAFGAPASVGGSCRFDARRRCK